MICQFIRKWGTSSGYDGHIDFPSGVAVDTTGHIYFTDTDNHQILKFASAGPYVTRWGGQGSGDGQFVYPRELTTDAAGSVYVADTINDRIQKFDSVGHYLMQWRSGISQTRYLLDSGNPKM